MSEPTAIKIDVNAKYILIIKEKLDKKKKDKLVHDLSNFLMDDDVHIGVIDGLDCTLEKVSE